MTGSPSQESSVNDWYEAARPDDRVALCHLAGAEREAGGDDSWQAFWNCGDSQGDRDLEVVDAGGDGEADGAPGWQQVPGLRRLPGQEVVVVDQPDEDADHKNDLQDMLTSEQYSRVPKHISDSLQ